MHWICDYLGTQWTPVDFNCWGFVGKVYRDKLGAELSFQEDVDADNKIEVAQRIAIASDSGEWEERQIPKEFDVVLMGRSTPAHVGIWTEADGGLIVHCSEGRGVNAISLQKARDAGYKIIRFYRHADHSRN